MTTTVDANDDSSSTPQPSSSTDRPDGQDPTYTVPRVRLAVWMVDT